MDTNDFAIDCFMIERKIKKEGRSFLDSNVLCDTKKESLRKCFRVKIVGLVLYQKHYFRGNFGFLFDFLGGLAA